MQLTKKQTLFFVLQALFITHALVGEILGGKIISFGPFVLSMGALPWPIVFISTDLINEYFGVKGVKKITWLTFIMLIYVAALLLLAIKIPAAPFSPVQDQPFQIVFSQSVWITVGSLTAFLVSQFIDMLTFHFFKEKFQGRWLWLRATGSTLISQAFDSFLVMSIAFLIPGKLTWTEFWPVTLTNYSFKFLVAVLVTPFIYAAHSFIDSYLETNDPSQ